MAETLTPVLPKVRSRIKISPSCHSVSHIFSIAQRLLDVKPVDIVVSSWIRSAASIPGKIFGEL
jgi:hypothetical protein